MRKKYNMQDWYRNIEEPIREVVRCLRDHGINTTCSCGHEMWIEGDYHDASDDQRTIMCVVLEMGFKEITLELKREIGDGRNYSRFLLKLTKELPK